MHGQALASEVFLKDIETTHQVTVVNTAKKKASGIWDKIFRNFEVVGILIKTLRGLSKTDLIYLTISESIFGNIKDILTYTICFSKLDRMVIHLHGGAGMANIMKPNKILASLNSFFIRRLKGVVVLGDTHKKIFRGITHNSKIHIVPNFSEDYLFLDQDEIIAKFNPTNSNLNILFLSNLLPGKGYLELLEAFVSLPDSYKKKIKINFAGGFASDVLKRDFLNRIKDESNIHYHGVVKGKQKRELFAASQVFCLPTYYPFEGQPISILEAYATGCAVITTNHSGIRDVFTPGINGFEVIKGSPDSIRNTLIAIHDQGSELSIIGAKNLEMAHKRFRTSIYNRSLREIMGL